MKEVTLSPILRNYICNAGIALHIFPIAPFRYLRKTFNLAVNFKIMPRPTKSKQQCDYD